MRAIRRHPALAAMALAVLALAFVGGLRWGLWLPLDEVQTFTVTPLAGAQSETTTPGTVFVQRSGRIALLTRHQGYLGMLLPPEKARPVFTDLDRLVGSWAAEYPDRGAGNMTALLRFELADSTVRTVRISNPDTNTDLPRSLRNFLTELGHWENDVVIGGGTIAVSRLRLVAEPLDTVAPQTAVYDFPKGYDSGWTAAGQTSVTVADPLVVAWSLDQYLLPGANLWTVRDRSGQLWRLATLVDWQALP